MAPDPDFRLPTAPKPIASARERAIGDALARFEAGPETAKGFPEGPRLKERQTAPRRPIMVHTRYIVPARYALATAAIAVVAAPFAWKLAEERAETRAPVARPEIPADSAAPPPVLETTARPPSVPRNATGETAAEAPRSPPIAQAPAPAGPARPAVIVESTVRALRLSEGSRSEGQAPSASDLRGRRAEAMPTLPGAPERRPPSSEPTGRDTFAGTRENGFRVVAEAPVSTFSIDVDTASYSFLRASLARNVLPPKASVRIEELINYFPYAYRGPATAAEPFAVTSAVFPSPWAAGRKIVQIGIKGYEVGARTRPAANLVFLVDTSGSMAAPNRLPLVKQSLALLLTQLEAKDRVAIVAYAGQAGTVLEPTPADRRDRILAAIDALEAGGGTAGGEGIRQAYALAERSADPKAVNRVILATDGDFNVGIADRDELKGFVERERGKGIFLSVLGFGMGNYNDALMQALAQNGNGAAAYIDTLNEARKVLVEEATSTLIPIARDVKIQVEFNPATVAEYRLIGYESRLLDRQDFANDRVDAGEVGSGQGVTALYEIVPAGGPRLNPDLRYGAKPAREPALEPAGEYAHVAIRYKLPEAEASTLTTTPIDRTRETARFEEAPQDARFATAVAAFGMLLKGGTHTGSLGLDEVARMASEARGEDPFGYRTEFVQLVRAAKTARGLGSP